MRRRRDVTLAAAAYVVGVVALFVIGVVLIALHRSFWSVNGAIVLVLVTIGLRPRLGRVPDRRDRVLRTSAPHLWELVDEVAAAADAPAPDHVVLDFAYGAETFRAGGHGETTLRLGARLWLALTAPQRVALLAYLLAEQVSGDPTRTRLVDSVLGVFHRTAEAFPLERSLGARWGEQMSRLNLVGALVDTVRWALAHSAAAVERLLLRWLSDDIAAARERALHTAARVAGTDAVRCLLARVERADEVERLEYHALAARPTREWAGAVEVMFAMHAGESSALEALPECRPELQVDGASDATLDWELSTWTDAARDDLLGSREVVERPGRPPVV